MFPRGPLSIDASGHLIGSTQEGGRRGSGTIFQITPKGEKSSEKVLYSFCSMKHCADGSLPQGGVLDQNGDFVGVARQGGANSTTGGTVFKFHDDSLLVMYSFCAENACTDGQNPVTGVALDASGDVFGVTQGGGVNFNGSVFELTP